MNPLVYAAQEERIFEAMLDEISGYQRKYTFFSDLAIAECYGIEAIEDTHKRVMKSWIDSIEAITEYIMSVNYKSWRFNGVSGKENLVQFYSELYYKAYDEVVKHYDEAGKSEELSYFFRVLD